MKNRTLFWLVLFGLMATGVGVVIATRGFRNNNPGNLRNAGVPWVGLVGGDADGYAIFDSLENGIRALGKDLMAKIGRGLNTIRSILYVYAPPSDNNPTEEYIARVAEWSGLNPDQQLFRTDIPDVAAAIIRFENGHAAPALPFVTGMDLALNS